jgi:hypothetical protein
MLNGYDKLRAITESLDHIVPGHDPLVMHRYPSVGAASDQMVALHLDPKPRT